MRFEYVTSAHPGTWGKLDLKTNASSLSVEMQDGTISVLLPNGEKCFVATVNQTYRLTFSSVDAGTPKTVPTSAGSLLLLGSPQNNANDAQFVLITLPPTIDQKKTEHPPK